MEWIVDRIESDTAVIEAGKEYINIPLKFLPGGVGEGDVISVNIDKNTESKRLKKARDVMNGLFSE